MKSAIFSMLLFPLYINAATINWIGDVSSDWNNPNNWAGNTLFANGDNVIIDPSNYTNAPIISANSTNSPLDVTVQNSGVLTISANLSITGDLIINSGGQVTQTTGVFDIGTGGNSKDISVDNGTLLITGGTTNLHGLLIGSNNSVITLSGGTILMDDEINLFSGASLTVSTTLTAVVQKDIEITDDASMTVETGAVISGFDDLEFFGDGGSYTQTGGTVSFNDQFEFFGTNATVDISGGTLSVAFDINFNSGSGNVINISGTGSLSADEILGTEQNINVTGGGSVGVTNQTPITSPITSNTVIDTQTFTDIVINVGVELTILNNATITVTGNITNNGTLTGLAGATVNFAGGNQTLINTGTDWNFKNINISNGATLDQNSAPNINVSGNFTVANGGTYMHSNNSITFTGTVQQTITDSNTGGGSLFSMIVNNTNGGVVLGSEMGIDGSLTLTNGILTTTSVNLLTLIDNATSSNGNANSFIDGPVTKIGNDVFTFPVGDGAVWAPVGISAPATVTTEFTAEYFFSAYSDLTVTQAMGAMDHVSGVEYWDVARAVTTDAVQVILNSKDQTRSDISDPPSADLIVAHFNGTDWENIGQAGISFTGGVGTVTSNSTSTFSPFAFGSSGGANPLPVELLYFKAVKQSGDVLLEWATATELNNDHFEIERSSDGISFSTIAQISGNGNSSDQVNYSLMDRNVQFGQLFYRLKQVDFDGRSETFKVIFVDGLVLENNISLYPNPSNGTALNLKISMDSGSESPVLSIYDMGGRIVSSHQLTSSKSEVLLAPRLKKGIYFAKIQIGDKVVSKKFIVE